MILIFNFSQVFDDRKRVVFPLQSRVLFDQQGLWSQCEVFFYPLHLPWSRNWGSDCERLRGMIRITRHCPDCNYRCHCRVIKCFSRAITVSSHGHKAREWLDFGRYYATFPLISNFPQVLDAQVILRVVLLVQSRVLFDQQGLWSQFKVLFHPVHLHTELFSLHSSSPRLLDDLRRLYHCVCPVWDSLWSRSWSRFVPWLCNYRMEVIRDWTLADITCDISHDSNIQLLSGTCWA